MRPSASSSQCSSTLIFFSDANRIRAVSGVVLPSPAEARINVSSGFRVSVGNEILTDRLLRSDIASIAFGELSFGSPLFGKRPGSVRQRGNGSWNRFLSFLTFFAQKLLQHSDAFIHVLFLEQKWRQEAHDRVLRGIE